jgi:hypothetical protein
MDCIDAHYREKARERGIEIIPLPKIDVNRLLTMSIECTPPFEDPESKTKEKGFRDSLIMFSILEAIRGRPEDSALVVTNDRLLANGLEMHAEEWHTCVRIASTLEDATAIIEGAITEDERLRLQHEMKQAIEMLMSHRDEISARVESIKELTDWDLGQSYTLSGYLFTQDNQRYVDIKTLESVSFDGITSAVWKEKDSEASRVLFSCRCNANVVVRAPHLRAITDQSRRYSVGQISSQQYLFTSISGDSGPTEKATLPFHMYGEAHFHRDSDAWRLDSLRIDKSPPSEEELNALMEARDSAFGTGAAT